jgi:CDP-diacylglycerol---glycerol-3-phosphate 3-phosphatidyltransferase
MKIVLLPETIKDKFRDITSPIVQFFVRYKLNPNFLTSISLILCLGAGYQFGKGSLRLGAIILLVGGLFDMIDGAVARASNRVTKFGALYDSTLDRYAEIVVFLGLLVFFVSDAALNDSLQKFYVLTLGAGLGGSLMVSYVRARAEGLGFECKVGIMQRPERIVLLALGALISKYVLVFVLLIIAILANVTAIQRIVFIWSHENAAKWKNLPPDVGHE